jgi:hypothetical protein
VSFREGRKAFSLEGSGLGKAGNKAAKNFSHRAHSLVDIALYCRQNGPFLAFGEKDRERMRREMLEGLSTSSETILRNESRRIFRDTLTAGNVRNAAGSADLAFVDEFRVLSAPELEKQGLVVSSWDAGIFQVRR